MLLKKAFLLSFGSGSDIAGEVVEVGRCVNDFAVGDKVVSWLFIRVSAPCEASITCLFVQ